jgi:hypothetical protein
MAVTEAGPYYPGTVVKSLSDAGVSSIVQAALATNLANDASGTLVAAAVNAQATALNQVLGVLQELGLRTTT